MKTSIDKGIEAVPSLAAPVIQANAWLTEELSDTAPLARAEWFLDRDQQGRRVVNLRLTDPLAGSEVGSFAPDELTQRYHMGARFYQIWGDLLRKRTQIHFDRFSELVRQLGNEEHAEDQHGDRSGPGDEQTSTRRTETHNR